MKRRKTFVGMAIFIAVLVLGVGYAAISDIELDLNGTANVKANADFNVEYDTNHTVVVSPTDTKIDWDGNADNSAEQDVVTGTYVGAAEASMTVYLDSVNREASAVYKIDNNSTELNASVTAEVTTDFSTEDAKYLSVTKELYTTEECNTVLGTTELAPGASAYLKVTVKLNKLPAIDVEDAKFKITLTASPADET